MKTMLMVVVVGRRIKSLRFKIVILLFTLLQVLPQAV
jgi:hypothetical protein